MRKRLDDTFAYIHPDTGALSPAPLPGADAVQGIVPGVTGPVVLKCAFHGRYHTVETISVGVARAGLATLEDFVRVTLAAVSPTCTDWKRAWHAFSVAFTHLRAGTLGNNLTRPLETLVAVGRALNTPRAFPDALHALASFQLPVDPPPLPIGGSFAVDPTGTILSLPPTRSRSPRCVGLPRDKSWCLVCCARHGWEHVSSLVEPDGCGRAALLDLGMVLIAQAVDTCDEFQVTREVLRRELWALPVRDHRDPGVAPARPLAAMRFYQDAAAAFSRATSDIGYVVARALEALG